MSTLADSLGERLVGSSVLFGLTFMDPDERIKSQKQLFGKVAKLAGPGTVELDHSDDVARQLPSRYLALAPRGTYKCRSNGEVVVDPDWLGSWCLIDTPGSRPRWIPNRYPLGAWEVPREWDVEFRDDEPHVRGLIEKWGPLFVGKSILVGLTHVSGEPPKFAREEQFHGIIEHVSYGKGVVVELEDGKTIDLPPSLAEIAPAPPGEYVERPTGQVILDPDFIVLWRVHNPNEQT